MINRYEKENKVFDFLESVKNRKDILQSADKCISVHDFKKWTTLMSTRLKNPPTQQIYNQTLRNIGEIKKAYDYEQAIKTN